MSAPKKAVSLVGESIPRLERLSANLGKSNAATIARALALLEYFETKLAAGIEFLEQRPGEEPMRVHFVDFSRS
jgi:hypothetical protein